MVKDKKPMSESQRKRLETIARKKEQQSEVVVIANELKGLASIIPSHWASETEDKEALLKSIHKDVLGLDKEGHARPINDLRYFLVQANQRKLNPFKKQIHAVYIWDSAKRAEMLVPITGIDGFRSIAQRAERPLYAGSSEPKWEMDKDAEGKETKYPKSATVSVYAYNPVTGAREIITTAVAWWDEYAKYVDNWVDELDDEGKKIWDKSAKRYKQKKDGQRLNSTWESRPKGQLAKCAEAMALRQAYPDDIGGMYTQEEVDHLQNNSPAPVSDEAADTDASREAKIAEKVKNFGKTDKAVEGEIVDESNGSPDKKSDTSK